MSISYIVFVFAIARSMLLVLAAIRNAIGIADTRFKVFWYSSCSNKDRCDVKEDLIG